MGYHIIDMASDPRCGQFAYFRKMDFPFAGITAEIDITDFMARKGHRPFFLSFLYAVTRAANAVPQLRRRIFEGGTVVEFDWCPPSYTAMKPDGVYVYCTVATCPTTILSPWASGGSGRYWSGALSPRTATRGPSSSYPACRGCTTPSCSIRR